MYRLLRIARGRRPVIVLTGVLVGLMVSGSAAAIGFDRHSFGILMPGTTIGGVQVGGLDIDAAQRLLKHRLEDPLHRPLHVTADGLDTTTTPWALGYRVDVVKASRDALEQ
jgi:hypothetical protein